MADSQTPSLCLARLHATNARQRRTQHSTSEGQAFEKASLERHVPNPAAQHQEVHRTVGLCAAMLGPLPLMQGNPEINAELSVFWYELNLNPIQSFSLLKDGGLED